MHVKHNNYSRYNISNIRLTIDSTNLQNIHCLSNKDLTILNTWIPCSFASSAVAIE